VKRLGKMKLDEWATQSLKGGKKFTEFTDDERAIMILSNHPLYQAHKEIMQEMHEECVKLDAMSEVELEEYFNEMQLDDGEWDI